MKEKIIIFVIGLLVGAVISTGAFFVYSKATTCNNMNNNQTMQMPRGAPPSMQNGQSNGNEGPPEKPSGDNNDNSQAPEKPNNENSQNNNTQNNS